MVKVLTFRLEKCFSPATILLVEGSSETGLFTHIYLTTFFLVRNFKNTTAMRVIFFWKMFKIDPKYPKFRKKLGKNFFFFFEIIASEDVARNCLY